MRFIVVIIAVLAGLKIWTENRIYRTAMADALVAAYHAKAVAACARRATPSAWGSASITEVVIGNHTKTVAIWDVGNPAWTTRYKNPQLVLVADASSPAASCSYDVKADRADIAIRN